MTAHPAPAPASSAPHVADASSGADDASLELQRELFVLQRVVEVGLLVIESIGRQAEQAAAPTPAPAPAEIAAAALSDAADPAAPAAPPPAPPPPSVADAALAYDRASRALRLTVLLKARLRGELAAQGDAAARAARNAAYAAAQAREAQRLARGHDIAGALTGIIGEAVRAEAQAVYDAADRPDADGIEVDDDRDAPAEPLETLEQLHERLVAEAGERLCDRERFDVLTRPASEIVAAICADLGLSPDWLRLAEQAWARQEVGSGKVGAPLRDLPKPAPPGGGAPAGTARDGPPPRPSLRRRLDPLPNGAKRLPGGGTKTEIEDGFILTLPVPPQTPTRGRRRPG